MKGILIHTSYIGPQFLVRIPPALDSSARGGAGQAHGDCLRLCCRLALGARYCVLGYRWRFPFNWYLELSKDQDNITSYAVERE